jgi:hypothetical protein
MTRRERVKWFKAEVDADYYKWRAGRRDHRGARYRREITVHGHIRAIGKLLDSKRNGQKRKVFGVEWIVVRPEFRGLFKPRQVAEARRRIARYWSE